MKNTEATTAWILKAAEPGAGNGTLEQQEIELPALHDESCLVESVYG
ncbi:MAG: hypothetical protein RIT45_2858, partial [Pseudomonadota bacterium]